jgi:hypothetical protein
VTYYSADIRRHIRLGGTVESEGFFIDVILRQMSGLGCARDKDFGDFEMSADGFCLGFFEVTVPRLRFSNKEVS